MISCGSLFSGIGGFDLGFERTGIRSAWQVEIDPQCQKLLEHKFPNAKRYVDVREVGSRNLEPVDLICGGFPCQDLSVAGRRAGLVGERSGLWFEFHRIVEEIKPSLVVIENVPGLLSSNGGRDFAVILRGLVKCGYGVAWRILDARYFGVAQRRRRVFIVASIGNGSCAQVLFESEGVSRDSEPINPSRERVTAPIKASSPSRRNGGSNPIDDEFVIAPSLYACGAGTDRVASAGNEAEFCIPVSKPLLGGGNSNNPLDENLIAFNRTGGKTSRDNPSSDSVASLKAKEHIAVALQMNFIRNPRIGDYTGSLQAQPGDAQFNGVYSNIYGVRRLTPTECERLQGFPDGWTDGFSDSTRYRMLGNAVCVNVAEWIGKRIARGVTA